LEFDASNHSGVTSEPFEKDHLVQDIVTIFEQRLLSIGSPEDTYRTEGRLVLTDMVGRSVKQGAPIRMLLPAFPGKSANTNKVTGKLPDAGELLALEYMNQTCKEIS